MVLPQVRTQIAACLLRKADQSAGQKQPEVIKTQIISHYVTTQGMLPSHMHASRTGRDNYALTSFFITFTRTNTRRFVLTIFACILVIGIVVSLRVTSPTPSTLRGRSEPQDSSVNAASFSIPEIALNASDKLYSVVIALPSLSHLEKLSAVACRLSSLATHTTVSIPSLESSANDQVVLGDCSLSVTFTKPQTTLLLSQSLARILNATNPEVFFGCYGSKQERLLQSGLRISPNATYIRMPCEDLEYADWMASLQVAEWRNWAKPKLELTVITNDRPNSLRRLFNSLARAVYFGDQVDISVNLEQTVDAATMYMVQNLSWKFGGMNVRHRVIRGGLLTSVVESWYPMDNDTFGVLLEDDVEVSPMFYAWLKMCILRYRYSSKTDYSPLLFGVSLYQQKTLELHPSGRRLLDIPTLFVQSSVHGQFSPYLSQIPCSWGAAFFPEHWREFHDYLVIRMSEITHDISEVIVPEVRSNTWRRSWKKYFIELAYLRGYLMLYPNFPDYVSLSTNHLEVGSHVKSLSHDQFEEKKALFTLPLMPLPNKKGPSLLDLPQRRLPHWHELPIIDLSGSVSSEMDVIRVGTERRVEVSGCDVEPAREHTFDARELLCGEYYERDGDD